MRTSLINKLSDRVSQFVRTSYGSMRFSITMRIALFYASKLFRSTLSLAILVSIIFWLLQYVMIQNSNMYLQENYADLFGNKPESQRVMLAGDKNASLIYADIDSLAEYSKKVSLNNSTYISINYDTSSLYFLSTFIKNGNVITLVRRINDLLYINFALVLTIGAFNTQLFFSFINRRKKLQKSVLRPIDDITAAASRLSAADLSLRINIAGTKNELKDLAAVINEMLDRIEEAYNNQKRFVSDASHELRTPIAVLQGYTDMLSRWGKNDPAILDEAIEAIKNETVSMRRLVESLLFLARHDKNTLSLNVEYFDASDIVEELAKETLLFNKTHIIQLAQVESIIIPGDRSFIKEALRVFIDNAIKYTDDGGSITLSCTRNGDNCILAVADNGKGIPENELQKIFERFYRADDARQSGTNGHGLGLAIAKIITKSHNGKLRVRSLVGKGSEFAIILPTTIKES